MTNFQPTIQQVIDTAFDRKLGDLHVHALGVIQSVDLGKRTVDVTRASKTLLPDGTYQASEVITSVPFVVLGGGGFEARFPIAKGDNCLLLYIDTSIDDWTQGSDTPRDPRQHHPHDLVALVGVSPPSSAPSDYADDRAELGKQGGPVVSAKGDSIHLGVSSGQDATEKAVLGDTFQSKLSDVLTSLQTVLGSLVLPSMGPVQSVNLPDLIAKIAALQSAPWLSQNVKLK